MTCLDLLTMESLAASPGVTTHTLENAATRAPRMDSPLEGCAEAVVEELAGAAVVVAGICVVTSAVLFCALA